MAKHRVKKGGLGVTGSQSRPVAVGNVAVGEAGAQYLADGATGDVPATEDGGVPPEDGGQEPPPEEGAKAGQGEVPAEVGAEPAPEAEQPVEGDPEQPQPTAEGDAPPADAAEGEAAAPADGEPMAELKAPPQGLTVMAISPNQTTTVLAGRLADGLPPANAGAGAGAALAPPSGAGAGAGAGAGGPRPSAAVGYSKQKPEKKQVTPLDRQIDIRSQVCAFAFPFPFPFPCSQRRRRRVCGLRGVQMYSLEGILMTPEGFKSFHEFLAKELSVCCPAPSLVPFPSALNSLDAAFGCVMLPPTDRHWGMGRTRTCCSGLTAARSLSTR